VEAGCLHHQPRGPRATLGSKLWARGRLRWRCGATAGQPLAVASMLSMPSSASGTSLELVMIIPNPSLKCRSWREAWLPPLPAIPAMTRQAEQQMFYWLTSSRYTGAGAVVELGCWLGAGTVALAAGLRDRGLSSRVIAVDRFVWRGTPNARVISAGLADGKEFEPAFRKYTQVLAPWIEPLRVDLTDFQWNGGPIEILVVDAPKKRADVMRFLKAFGPALIPGKSLVAFQDYLYETCYALPAMLACFPEVFRLVDVAMPGSTALFEVHGVLSLDAERQDAIDFLRWGAAETVQHWQQNVLPALPKKARVAARISLALMLHRQGHYDAALAEFRRAVGDPEAESRIRGLAGKRHYYARYKDLFRSLDIKPKRLGPKFYLNRANIHLKSGRLDAAAEDCRAVLAEAPEHPKALAMTARIERKRRLWRRGVRALRRFVNSGRVRADI
jgi:tetratricopeptide (TPR) repeat protein